MTDARPVVLVDLYWTRDKDPRVPLGHGSILAMLRSSGVEVAPVVYAVNDVGDDGLDVEALADEVIARAVILGKGCCVAIGVYVWAEKLVQLLLPALRRGGFEGLIILGGPQISYTGPGVARLYPDANVFIRGYGEEALLDVLHAAAEATNPGVVFAAEQDGARPATVNLDALPSPWLNGIIRLDGQKFIRWETQRGCQFRCAFCQHREAGSRLLRRALNWDRIAAEIDLFCAAGVEDIAVLDPIFNMGPFAIPVLKRFVERGYSGQLSLQCRAETTTAEFVELAAQLDVQLEFGLQTTNPDEGKAINRNNHMQSVDATLARVRDAGIDHLVSLIFGLPLQTNQSFEESVRWCLEREVPVIKAFPLLLLRGTPLERDRRRWGLVDSGGPMAAVIESTSFGFDDWLKMASISEGLRLTEGRHPSFDDLLDLAATLKPDFLRWMPAELWSAA